MAYLHRMSTLARTRPTRGDDGDDGKDCSHSRSGHGELLFARQVESCQREFAVRQRVVLVGFVFGGNENVDGRVRD